MLYITNAFSLNMITTDRPSALRVFPIDAESASEIIHSGDFEVISIIGHQNVADVVSDDLGCEIPMNRQSVSLNDEDTLIVCQYSGPRLDEHAKALPENAKMQYFHVFYEEDDF